jgi:hypothetical protein
VSNFVISSIRTGVPIIVGAVVAFLAKKADIIIEDDTSQAAVIALTGAAIAIYYGLVHAIEQRWPKVGVLLGKADLPHYPTADQ